MRTVTYARVSVDREGRHVSTSQQSRVFERVVAREGLDVVRRFEDNHRSASRFARRPRRAFVELMDTVRSGDVDAILVWDVDRLMREMRALEELLDYGRDRKLRLFSAGADDVERYDLDNPRHHANLRGAMTSAILESELNSKRVKRSRADRREVDKLATFGLVYGWDDAGTPNVVEADEVRRMIDRVLAGDTLASIAAGLTERGVPRKRDGRRNPDGSRRPIGAWTTVAVKSVVSTPRHYGLVHHCAAASSVTHNPLTEGRNDRGNFDGIVEPERFLQVRAALSSRSRKHRPPRLGLLTNLLVCESCSTTLGYTRAQSRPMLRCVRGTGKAGCGLTSLHADVIEQYVTELVLAWVDRADLATLVAESCDSPAAVKAASELAGLADTRRDLAGELARGMSARSYGAAVAALDVEEERLERLVSAAASTSVLAGYAERAGALRDAWPSMTLAARREVIIEALELSGSKLSVTPNREPGRRRPKWDPSDVDAVAGETSSIRLTVTPEA